MVLGGKCPLVQQLKQEQRDGNRTYLQSSGGAFLLDAIVDGGVHAQAETEQAAHVPQKTGKRRGVQVNPFWLDAPFLGFVQSPEEIHSQSFEQKVETDRKGGQAEGDEEVLVHAGLVDPFALGDNLSYKNA